MGICTCNILASSETAEGHSFNVTIETSMAGMARLNVACHKPDSDDVLNSQGVDLTPAECRALAKMLAATADLVEEPDDD